MNRGLLIAGTGSGVGKTTVTMGLLTALTKRMKVQPYKVGPDYIDPAYHTFITGLKSRNLDNFLMDNVTMEALFLKSIKEADIGIIEGAMGLYDGSTQDPSIGSSASIAKAIGCPVVLIVDGSGMSMSAAALVKGYAEFDPLVQLKGVIFNRVNSNSHYELLKDAVESHTQVKCYGYLTKNLPSLPSRHLGLVPSCEIENLKEMLETIREAFEATVDVEGLIALSNDLKQVTAPQNSDLPYQALFKGVRIGVAYDQAFNFYYEDNFELLRELGAQILFFSPIRDQVLPEDLHFLYFGGGYPEQFAKELSENWVMKNWLLEKLEKGIPYLAECGGLMYLCQKLVDFDGKSYDLLGWLPGETHMTKSLKRFGYKTLKLKKTCILGPVSTEIKIHEFHHSEIYGMTQEPVYELKKSRLGQASRIDTCGYVKGNGIAGYPHFHFYGNTTIATNLLNAAATYKTQIEKS